MFARLQLFLARKRARRSMQALDASIRDSEVRIRHLEPLPPQMPKWFQAEWREGNRRMLEQLKECRRISAQIHDLSAPPATPRRSIVTRPVPPPSHRSPRTIPGL
jgi:hypothetical protein